MDTNFEQRFIEARRELIRRSFPRLNDRQLEAVLATEGPLLILAGAGSGKTTVLINRIANLLKYGRGSDSDEMPAGADQVMLEAIRRGGPEGERYAAVEPVEPWRILAITFTNKAADELKDRLERMLGPESADVWACTFHSACVRMLRRDAEKLGYPSSFTIYDTSDSQSLAKRIVKDLNLDEKSFPPRALLAEISRAKDAQIGAEQYLAAARSSGDIRRIRYGEFYREYARRLFAAGAMDFDDLIACTVKLLQENEEVRGYWQRRFRYVLIDEYQDTNHLQYLFASLLADGWGNICVVGDDDQSIYKFRGATIENILSFESRYRGCRTIRLEQNYRSTGLILEAANGVIRNNLGRKGKELWTDKDKGLPIRLYVADNEHEEAQYVATQILASYGKGAKWRDHAILYRMNAQSNQLEYAFKRNGIPYRIIGGTRFFDRAEVKDVLAYLCVIAVPSDDLRLSRIINNPPRGIGARSVESAQEIAARERISLYEVLKRADEYPELQRASIRMRQLAAMLDELHELSGRTSADELLDELLERTGYLKMLEDKNTDEDLTRAENVREIKTSILGFQKESGDCSLTGFLADVALYTDLDAYDRDADCVTMMTMHSAKGLEFPCVFLVGMEETIFPGVRAIGEPEEMEEERRLCYVAITRAMRRLEIVCARQRMLFGRTTSNRVSRFVDEIPPNCIEKKNIPRGYAYSDRSPASSFTPHTQTAARYTPAPAAPKAAAAAPKRDSFAVGDLVLHKAFGPGVLVKMTPMGGDHLIEVQFEKVGTKKLMLRVAAMNMTKAK
ncbi:MAG: UvrD-helicase domain-containing protein [Oscillospiraceae bacterium]|nr:UvrD-helicase domain-containing protein [Oscillospiraceae bacterium]